MKVTMDFLPNKAIPTWVVREGKMEWFFTANNGSVFDHPRDRANRLYNKLKER